MFSHYIDESERVTVKSLFSFILHHFIVSNKQTIGNDLLGQIEVQVMHTNDKCTRGTISDMYGQEVPKP